MNNQFIVLESDYLFSHEGDKEERQKAGFCLVSDYNTPAWSASDTS
jgi:hypothetical protein